MPKVTKQDILCPPGQKFPVGCTVRVAKACVGGWFEEGAARDVLTDGRVLLVEKSYGQHMLIMAYRGDRGIFREEFQLYSLIDPETGTNHCWIPEDRLELVEEE